MYKGERQDPHFDSSAKILRNLAGLADPELLQRFEADISAVRLAELALRAPLGVFDVAHVKAIHRFIFQDVYPWAGEFRQVNFARGNQPEFAQVEHIESSVERITERLGRENRLAGLSAKVFSERAGYFLGELNAVHPFLEGNGRAQREFIRSLAAEGGHTFVWRNISAEEMIEASKRSFLTGDASGLTALISRCIL